MGTGAEYLMVEDNVYDAEIALFDLEEHGMANNFHIAGNGVEALDYLFGEDGSLRVEPPKAIFLDLHMPKIDGLEFLQRIKSDAQTKSIPVVVLRSSISPSEERECHRLGVNEFLAKPLTYKGFVAVIRKFSNLVNHPETDLVSPPHLVIGTRLNSGECLSKTHQASNCWEITLKGDSP